MRTSQFLPAMSELSQYTNTGASQYGWPPGGFHSSYGNTAPQANVASWHNPIYHQMSLGGSGMSQSFGPPWGAESHPQIYGASPSIYSATDGAPGYPSAYSFDPEQQMPYVTITTPSTNHRHSELSKGLDPSLPASVGSNESGVSFYDALESFPDTSVSSSQQQDSVTGRSHGEGGSLSPSVTETGNGQAGLHTPSREHTTAYDSSGIPNMYSDPSLVPPPLFNGAYRSGPQRQSKQTVQTSDAPQTNATGLTPSHTSLQPDTVDSVTTPFSSPQGLDFQTGSATPNQSTTLDPVREPSGRPRHQETQASTPFTDMLKKWGWDVHQTRSAAADTAESVKSWARSKCDEGTTKAKQIFQKAEGRAAPFVAATRDAVTTATNGGKSYLDRFTAATQSGYSTAAKDVSRRWNDVSDWFSRGTSKAPSRVTVPPSGPGQSAVSVTEANTSVAPVKSDFGQSKTGKSSSWFPSFRRPRTEDDTLNGEERASRWFSRSGKDTAAPSNVYSVKLPPPEVWETKANGVRTATARPTTAKPTTLQTALKLLEILTRPG